MPNVRVLPLVAGVILSGLVLAQGAAAQQVKKSTLSGLMLSDAVTLAANGSATFAAPPPDTFLIITQVCVTDDAQLQVGAKTLAMLPGGRCRTWTFGFAVPPGAAVVCHDLSGNANACDLTGVVTR